MATKTKQIDVRDTIMDYLKEIERDLAWLSRKLDIPYGTLYSTFVHKIIKLSQEKLDRINLLLETDFTL